MQNLTVFREPDSNYLTVIVDGRIVDGLGKDEALMTVACALIGTEPPPYAKGQTVQEIRENERERGKRLARTEE